MGLPPLAWVFIIIGAVVLAALLVPVVVILSYKDGEFNVWLRSFFLKINIYPNLAQRKPREKRKKKKRKDERKEGEEGKEEPKKKRTLPQILYLVKRIASSFGAARKMLFKGLWFYDVELVFPVDEGDAADTAIRFGQIQALVGGARAAVENLVHVRYKRLVVIPDFASQHKDETFFSCKVAAMPVIMIVAGVIGFRAFLKYRKVNGPPPLSREQKKELERRREERRAQRQAEREKKRAEAEKAKEAS